MKKTKKKPQFENLLSTVEMVKETSAILGELNLSLHHGSKDVIVITGPNASGKSLLVRVLSSFLAEYYAKKMTGISISIRERSGSGYNEMSRMIFGNEKRQSTGATSVSVVVRAFENTGSYPCCLILDEPEIGLSAGYCKAFGKLIGQKTKECLSSDTFNGLILISHNKDLIANLTEELGERPTFLNTAGLSYDEYMYHEEVFSVEDLTTLQEKSSEFSKSIFKKYDL